MNVSFINKKLVMTSVLTLAITLGVISHAQMVDALGMDKIVPITPPITKPITSPINPSPSIGPRPRPSMIPQPSPTPTVKLDNVTR